MVSTEAPQNRAVGADRPRRLTVADAIEQWTTSTRAIEGLKVLQKEAADVLLANAMKTGRRTFRNEIAVVQTGGSVVLDQEKVRNELGPRLGEFLKRTKLGWTLKLL